MPCSVFRLPAIAFFLLLLTAPAWADDAKPVNVNSDLAAADQLYRAGKFAEAETGYRTALKADLSLVAAEAGLVRAMLQQQKIDEAFEAVNSALATQPGSTALLTAKGDVQFRRGELAEAEVSYLAAKKLDHNEVKAYLGLARIYGSFSLYRHAYDQLMSAHQIAPQDIEVQRAWMGMLSRKERRWQRSRPILRGPIPTTSGNPSGCRNIWSF
jgi:tetratricopeptide (TPR) repeat protein